MLLIFFASISGPAPVHIWKTYQKGLPDDLQRLDIDRTQICPQADASFTYIACESGQLVLVSVSQCRWVSSLACPSNRVVHEYTIWGLFALAMGRFLNCCHMLECCHILKSTFAEHANSYLLILDSDVRFATSRPRLEGSSP